MGMTSLDVLKVAATVILSFGGGAAIVVGLSKWLGSLWATRILQNEEHELSLRRSSYEHYLDLIIAYYKLLYGHYRMCQRATVDAYRQADGTIVTSKDEFLGLLDEKVAEWRLREGEIRLLLPSQIMDSHEAFITAFNSFKKSVQEYDGSESARSARASAFATLDQVKQRMETQLREFLRTEKLLK